MSEVPGTERVIAGRYRLLSPLGEGGMGTVWRARDEMLHREVAVKEVRAPAGLPRPDVERLYARLEREAWAAARITDRNVVTVYDVATEDGRPWIVMELVRGLSLADALDAEGPMTPQRAARIGAEVLAALRAAHGAGVLHRDVKPANVLLANDGRVVLTDFGIATVEGTSALTMTGEVIGSPEFLAPERALGRTPGPESDLWSLGVLLYAAVEGSSPFRQDTPLSTLRAVVDEELPPPRRAGPLAPVIEGLLRKDPALRLPAERAEQDLRVVAAGGSPTAPTARVPVTPYPPTRPYEPTVTTPPQPVPAVRPGPGGPAGPTVPASHPDAGDPGRRARIAVVAGLVALALALAGLMYALLNGGGNGGGGGAAGSGSPGVTSAPPGTSTAAHRSASASGSTSAGSGASSAAPEQSVHVTVTGTNTDYAGTCPPPGAQAPGFTATFTVGRLPAEVSYRWVAKNGVVADSGWTTLSFPAGGGRTRTDEVTVTTYHAGAVYAEALRVEVRSPVQAVSDWVPFTVECTTETPTGGASASSSASP
ncbi:serine/threonine-protein kinase [Streptomyces sp. NPDC047000]|uniref:serine/threonine-protein kinase n=1 Tax=Streptomyces sp. NPDC047000 TaxID=3155474 RepID=UPI00340FB8CD